MTDPRTATEPETDREREEEWEGYRLGDPIPLHDFLALPDNRDRNNRRLDRDGEGRLFRMLPDDQFLHRIPMAGVQRTLFLRHIDPRFWIIPEPGLVLPRLIHLQGHALPPSRLGPAVVEPDLVVFDGVPRKPPPPVPRRAVLAERARLVVEVLSKDTFRNDLGLGKSDNLDRWASYLASGIPELWIVNVGVERPCPLPPRSGLFLRNATDRWEPLPCEGAAHASGEVHGLRPLVAGRVRSLAVGLEIDLAELWETLDPPQE
jgi:hypothetical protein